MDFEGELGICRGNVGIGVHIITRGAFHIRAGVASTGHFRRGVEGRAGEEGA